MRKRIFILTFLMVVLISNLIVVNSFGASVSASLSGGGSYAKGQKITVRLTYSGTSFGSADVIFNYDTSVLKLTSTSDGPQSASGVFTQSIADEHGNSTLSCTATFEAVGIGNTTVTATTSNIYDINFNLLSTNTASTSISVTNPSSSASSNANLSSLKVSAGSLSPSFSPSRTSYTVNVGEDVSVCTISATPQDSAVTVSVGGSKNLSMGKNVRTVTVTAENGATKTYTITINRGEGGTSSEDPSDDPSDSSDGEIEDITVTVGDKEYIVCENYDESSIPKGFVMTIAQYGDKDIPVIKDENLKYTFALLRDPETGDETWFFYDEENDTFAETAQISAEDAMEYGRLLAELNGDDQDSKSGSKDRILIIALGATVVVLAALVLILQVGIINKNKKKLKKNKKSEEEIDITDEKPYEDMDIEEQQQSDHETEDDYTDTEREDQ